MQLIVLEYFIFIVFPIAQFHEDLDILRFQIATYRTKSIDLVLWLFDQIESSFRVEQVLLR